MANSTRATKLTVSTEVGRFTRTTARTYTHLVVVGPVKHETLEANRLREIKHLTSEAARYRRVVAVGADPSDNHPFHREHTAKCLADGSYARWIEEIDARVAALKAKGVILADAGTPGVIGWCGRLDLARKLRAGSDCATYRWARVFDVATGEEAR